ncbi:MAG: sarcosine oxidase subunit gamma [Hyphomicrobiaceae bacterium]
MSDHHTRAERRHVFCGQNGPPDAFADGDFALRLLPPAARFSLRIDAATASATRHPAGFDLAQSINALSLTQVQGGDARLSARLGPDEWLLIADRGDGEALFRTLAQDLGDHVYSLVDISHRNLALEVIGDAAVEVLNSGCPLDLGDRSFPEGAATRTLFAKSEIVLMRDATPDKRPLFRIECWRSFGRYVHAHLCDAATLIGVGG